MTRQRQTHRHSFRRPSFEELELRRVLSVSFLWHDIDPADRSSPASDIAVADWDADGDLDLLVARSAELVWYENVDGRGSFGPPTTLADAGDVQALDTADMDGDSDIDVIVFCVDDCPDHVCTSEIVWLENSGVRGAIESEHPVGTEKRRIAWHAFKAADVDKDGRVDIVTAGADIGITDGAWFKNTGKDQEFSRHTFEVPETFGAWSLATGDLDGDGDLDVLWGGFFVWETSIYWLENLDGQGTLSGPHGIASGYGFQTEVFAGDLDGDGDLDVLHGAAGSHSLQTGIAWNENLNGDGDFGPQRLIEPRPFNGDMNIMHGLFTVDIDTDGDTDVLVALNYHHDDCDLAWYENDGNGGFGAAQQIGRDGLYDYRFPPHPVVPADIDGDGDPDIVTAIEYESSRIGWFENLSPRGAAPGDANRDGEFNRLDLIQVLQSAKYLTAEPATWEHGDWNGDGVFDQLDLVLALQEGNYLSAPTYCWDNGMCGDDEYCYFADCALETGECQPRPVACTREWDPVCGCDGETYGNECEAAAAGVSVDHRGECGRDAAVQ